MPTAAPTPLIATALKARCPRCGEGPLFDGYIKVAPKCSVCGLGFVGHDTGDAASFFIMLPLCIVTALLALVFDRLVDPPIWVHLIVWPIFIAAVVGYSLRPVKAIMIGLQYRYRSVERDEER